MPRYIDADAFIKEQCNSCDGYCEKVDCDCLNCDKPYQCGVIQELKNAPTVSPDEARGVGKWIKRFDGPYGRGRTYCSTCGKHSGIGGIKQTPPYCPNCGARMGGVQDALS